MRGRNGRRVVGVRLDGGVIWTDGTMDPPLIETRECPYCSGRMMDEKCDECGFEPYMELPIGENNEGR
jgi:hypothetical protein